MGLEQLTEHVFYLPHEPETDRPMLAYVRGGRFSLAIDAGYSAAHVGAFYRALSCAGMPEPDFTMLTHWHYDHSFGLHCVHGASFAHWRTNDFLRQEREKARCDGYFTALRREDPFYAREYTAQVDPEIVPAGVSFRDGLRFELGGLAADASHIEAPHSEDCVCIYVPEDRVLFWATQPARTSSMEIIWIKASCGGSWNGLKTRTASIVFSAMQRRCENRSCWNIWRVFLHHVTRTVRCPYKAPQKVRSIEPAEIVSAAGRACCL